MKAMLAGEVLRDPAGPDLLPLLRLFSILLRPKPIGSEGLRVETHPFVGMDFYSLDHNEIFVFSLPS